MDWTYTNDCLPELIYAINNKNLGKCQYSKNCLIATQNGGLYIGYYEVDTMEGSAIENKGWYTASVQDAGIDTDGVMIYNVIAWQDLPVYPSSSR